mmetsp:Transcript_23786/g.47279  ORF Transcript_23786/g.47279 Transcript_23786/m.47279 type:complete len:95 (-) Transcript_23786:340-624(-)
MMTPTSPALATAIGGGMTIEGRETKDVPAYQCSAGRGTARTVVLTPAAIDSETFIVDESRSNRLGGKVPQQRGGRDIVPVEQSPHHTRRKGTIT